MEILNSPVITNVRQLQEKEKIKITPGKMREPSTNSELKTTEEETPERRNQNLYDEFIQWRLNPTAGKFKIKPNAIGKLWTQVIREELLPFSEEQWMNKFGLIIEKILDKKITIVRLQIGDPTITPIGKELIQESHKFTSLLYPENSFQICFTNTREITKEEKNKIIKEAHSDHLGEQNTLDKAQKLEICQNMEQDIAKYVKSCLICPLNKTT